MYGDRKIEQMAEYDELALGELKYGKGLFLVAPMPMSTPTVDGVEVIGMLSGSAFRGVDFELDMAHKKLKMFSQDHCPGARVYWSDQYSSASLLHGRAGELFFPVELEGKNVYVAIQNGRPETTIGTDVTRWLYGFDKSSRGVEQTSEADGTPSYYCAMQLTAQGLKVAHARIRLVDPEKTALSMEAARSRAMSARVATDVPGRRRSATAAPVFRDERGEALFHGRGREHGGSADERAGEPIARTPSMWQRPEIFLFIATVPKRTKEKT
jgi:hypothetical protein